MNRLPAQRHIDGLVNPKVYHRPTPKPKRSLAIGWPWLLLVVVVALSGWLAAPRVKSFTRQLELLDLTKNGRYLVLFQNDAERRASGGFIGSFAVVQVENNAVKPLYFATNIYKLDDPFTLNQKIEAPKPLRVAVGERGWALRDSNFAADFRQSAPTIAWFFEQEVKNLTGASRIAIDKALNSNYKVDGVIATTLSAFHDILDATGPIELSKHNVTLSRANFFPIVQQVVERDYFKDPANKITNEPKTILQDLFPIAMNKVQNLPKTTQYALATKLLQEKKVILYSTDQALEQTLVDQGWAGALELAADLRPKEPADFLAVISSSHGGNKSSNEVNSVYRYSLDRNRNQLKAKLEITYEHQGTGQWPSGVNQEYIRVLTPYKSHLINAYHRGQNVTKDIDIGKEMDKSAFGYWLRTEPKTSQTLVLEYILSESLTQNLKDYQVALYRQPGGNSPDITVTYEGKVLYQGRLGEDKVIIQ